MNSKFSTTEAAEEHIKTLIDTTSEDRSFVFCPIINGDCCKRCECCQKAYYTTLSTPFGGPERIVEVVIVHHPACCTNTMLKGV